MSYRIEYNMMQIKKTPIKPRRNKKYIKKALLIFIIAVSIIVFQAKGGLLEILFPGEGLKAQIALEQMVSDIKDGQSLRDAATAFCLEIIEYE